MKSWKLKIILPFIIIALLALAKYILWNFPVSTGKRVGSLTKISKKGRFIPTWEGTIDEGSGDKLTSNFSVKNEELATELYNYEGKQVILYYEQYILGWPRDTNYNITAWKPKDFAYQQADQEGYSTNTNNITEVLSKTLFCSLIGSLFSNPDLYQKVKAHVKENNLYLYNQIDTCNE